MVHSVDRQALADTLFDGEVPPPDTIAYRSTPYFADLERVIAKYPYDARRTEQLMTEAGFRRGADGFFATGDGRRFQPDYNVRQSTQFERGQSIMVDSWRRAGLDVTTSVLPNVTVPEMVRHTFPSIVGRTMAVEDFNLFAGSEVGLESNRWRGQNRAGWSNPEYDRLYDQFRNTIDRKEGDRLAVQLLKLASEEVPFYVVYESPALMAHVTALKGPDFPAPGPPVTTPVWNIHEWEMTS
jgi:ABC-type transport system substrate-binding protein